MMFNFPYSNKHEHKKSPRPSTLESNLDFLLYCRGRTVSATPTILWKERTIDHILRAFLIFRNHANTLYRTDCLNGKSTSSDFNMIQPGFRGTECSKTAFYRWFYEFLNSLKYQKKKKKKPLWLQEKSKELGWIRERWARQHTLFPSSVGRQLPSYCSQNPTLFTIP